MKCNMLHQIGDMQTSQPITQQLFPKMSNNVAFDLS